MLIILEVTIEVAPTPEQEKEALLKYVPTPLVPEAGYEWVCEEFAMNLIETLPGVKEVNVLEVSYENPSKGYVSKVLTTP